MHKTSRSVWNYELVGGSSSNSFRGNSTFSSHDVSWVDYYYKSKSYCRTTKIRVENNLDPHRQALKQQRRPQVPASPLLPFMRQRSNKFAYPPLQTWHGLAPNTDTHLPSWIYTTLKSLLCVPDVFQCSSPWWHITWHATSFINPTCNFDIVNHAIYGAVIAFRHLIVKM